MRASSPRGQVGGACRGGEMKKDRANGWELGGTASGQGERTMLNRLRGDDGLV